MNASEIKKHLFSLSSKGIKYDLNRITEAAQKCGNPHLAYKCFHVAGTNGKGSTCAYIESMLRTSGFKTALYTSPHILQFEERFQINGKVIDEQQWLDVYEDLKHIVDDFSLTFFEAATLIAFELFRRNNVEWVVFETGLGGRLDATNLVKPEVSVITRIAFDHTDLLGKDLVSIAAEKAGIIKKNIPAVVACNDDIQVLNVLKQRCDAMNAPCSVVSFSDAQNITETSTGISFTRKGLEYCVSMAGQYQVINALLALEAVERASLLDYNACVKGLASTFLPCRFQDFFHNGKRLILDVGHNPDAADAFVKNIKKNFANKNVCIITGIMKDKDYPEIIRNYAQIANTIIFTRPDVERASQPEDLMKSFVDNKNRCLIRKTICESIETAFSGSYDLICIAGSFFTVGEACKILGINPFKTF